MTTLTQSAINHGTGATVVVALAAPTAAGATIAVISGCRTGGTVVTGVTDDKSNTYTAAKAEDTTGTPTILGTIWKCSNPIAGVTAVTVTYASSGNTKQVHVLEIPGRWDFPTTPSSATAALWSASAGHPTALSVTTTAAPALILAACAAKNNTTLAPTFGSTGWNQVDGPSGTPVTSGSVMTSSVAFKDVPSIGSDGPAWTVGSSSETYQTLVHLVPGSGNTTPIANAGPDQVSGVGLLVTLDGSGSFDADVGDSISHAWTRNGGTGPAVTLANPTTIHPSFTPTAAGTYTFKDTVTDTHAASAFDNVTVTVTADANFTPHAGAYVGVTIKEPHAGAWI